MNRRSFLQNILFSSVAFAVNPSIKMPLQGDRLLIVDGNSLSCLANVALPYEWSRRISVNCPVINLAVAGDHITPIARRAPYYVDPLIKLFNDTVVVLWEGTNSLWKLSPEQAFAEHLAYAKARKALGAKVIIGTIINRYQESWPQHEALRITFNDLVRANASEFDGVMDLGASPELGYEGAAKTNLYRDGVHLADAGYQIVARYAQTAINQLWDNARIKGPELRNMIYVPYTGVPTL